MKLSSHRLLCLALALVFLSAIPVAGQSGAPYHTLVEDSLYLEAIRTAQQIVRTHMDTTGIPGVTAAVLVDGRIVWSEGFGWADVENRVPVWPHTKMRIGSVSKSLTSAALGILYEEGKLDLDAPVQKYVPSFPEKRYPITTRQVAGHLAGIRHYRDQEFLSSKHYDTVKAGLAIFADDTLLFKPGERYRYSSYGWNLISAVVEGASGQDFLRFMHERVFRPLGLRHTVPDEPYLIIYQRTRFYVRDRQHGLRNAPFVDNSYKWAGGGFLSTAEDLVRFGYAMLNGDLLRPETTAMLFASMKTNDGQDTHYGLGWRNWDLDGVRAVGHTGGSVGGSSILIMLPEEKIVVALICNLSGGRLFQPGKQILLLFRNDR